MHTVVFGGGSRSFLIVAMTILDMSSATQGKKPLHLFV